ncbi:MAG: adenosylcobinamide-GDP ribazoletransferase [Spirochaetaceae bacterium]|jgi:adenosylcobinamide-GDP ribazoletransferase|nr:adenosylcobinamide-GDP ribazoletransferase [Spirochaetaceae bacterium]
MFNRFFSVLGLVCRIPFHIRYTFDLSRADFFLPLIGIFPALLGAGAYLAVQAVGTRMTAVLAGLAVQYLSFNLFHLDGLADTADAFLGNFDREKRFAILKDSRIGVYGLFGVCGVLALKASLLRDVLDLVSRNQVCLIPEIFAYPISGRLGAALIPGVTGPAKPDGLGVLLKGASPARAGAGALIALGIWDLLGRGLLSTFYGGYFFGTKAFLFGLTVLAPPLVGVLVSLGIARMYRRHLGGYTGDALGAAVELGELAHLASIFLLFSL